MMIWWWFVWGNFVPVVQLRFQFQARLQKVGLFPAEIAEIIPSMNYDLIVRYVWRLCRNYVVVNPICKRIPFNILCMIQFICPIIILVSFGSLATPFFSALVNHEAQTTDELCFQRGELIELIANDNGSGLCTGLHCGIVSFSLYPECRLSRIQCQCCKIHFYRHLRYF